MPRPLRIEERQREIGLRPRWLDLVETRDPVFARDVALRPTELHGVGPAFDGWQDIDGTWFWKRS